MDLCANSSSILSGHGLQNICETYCEWEDWSEISAQFLNTIWENSTPHNYQSSCGIETLVFSSLFFSWIVQILKMTSEKQPRQNKQNPGIYIYQNASELSLCFVSFYTSAQTDNNVCIMTGRKNDANKEQHLHTLSI